jgi:hypothetical protein
MVSKSEWEKGGKEKEKRKKEENLLLANIPTSINVIILKT